MVNDVMMFVSIPTDGNGDECGCDPSTCLNRSIQKKKIKLNCVSIRDRTGGFGINQHTRMCLEKALPKDICEVYKDKKDGAKPYFIEKRLCPAINNFQYFVAEHAEYASCYDPKLVNKPSESKASFMMTDVLRSMLCGNTNSGECRVIEYLLRLMVDMALDHLKTEICGEERSKRRCGSK
eukprot:276434_1